MATTAAAVAVVTESESEPAEVPATTEEPHDTQDEPEEHVDIHVQEPDPVLEESKADVTEPVVEEAAATEEHRSTEDPASELLHAPDVVEPTAEQSEAPPSEEVEEEAEKEDDEEEEEEEQTTRSKPRLSTGDELEDMVSLLESTPLSSRPISVIVPRAEDVTEIPDEE